jgi:hypothetical protein
MKKVRGGVAGVAIIALLASTGCFGSFATTRAIHNFNRNISPNRWFEWGIFLGLTFVPVYEGAVILDAVVMNSAEFWTGQNPFAPPPSQQSQNPREQGGAASLTGQAP